MALISDFAVRNKEGTVLEVKITGAEQAVGGSTIDTAENESISSGGTLLASLTGDITILAINIAGHATVPTWGTITVVDGGTDTVFTWACGANGAANITPNVKITGLTLASINYTSGNSTNYPAAILITIKIE